MFGKKNGKDSEHTGGICRLGVELLLAKRVLQHSIVNRRVSEHLTLPTLIHVGLAPLLRSPLRFFALIRWMPDASQGNGALS